MTFHQLIQEYQTAIIIVTIAAWPWVGIMLMHRKRGPVTALPRVIRYNALLGMMLFCLLILIWPLNLLPLNWNEQTSSSDPL